MRSERSSQPALIYQQYRAFQTFQPSQLFPSTPGEAHQAFDAIPLPSRSRPNRNFLRARARSFHLNGTSLEANASLDSVAPPYQALSLKLSLRGDGSVPGFQ